MMMARLVASWGLGRSADGAGQSLPAASLSHHPTVISWLSHCSHLSSLEVRSREMEVGGEDDWTMEDVQR